MCEHLSCEFELCLTRFALCHVADDAGHKPAVNTVPFGQREFYRKLLPVLAQATQLHCFPENARFTTARHAMHARQMRGLKSRRNQKGHGLAHGLRFGVAKDDLGAPIPSGDMACAVGRHDGIKGRLGDGTVALLAGTECLVHLVARNLAGKPVQRKADMGGHLHQQLAGFFIKGIHLAGVNAEGANDHATLAQWQCRRRGPAKLGRPGMQGNRAGVMENVLVPLRRRFTQGGCRRAIPVQVVGLW